MNRNGLNNLSVISEDVTITSEVSATTNTTTKAEGGLSGNREGPLEGYEEIKEDEQQPAVALPGTSNSQQMGNQPGQGQSSQLKRSSSLHCNKPQVPMPGPQVCKLQCYSRAHSGQNSQLNERKILEKI